MNGYGGLVICVEAVKQGPNNQVLARTGPIAREKLPRQEATAEYIVRPGRSDYPLPNRSDQKPSPPAFVFLSVGSVKYTCESHDM